MIKKRQKKRVMDFDEFIDCLSRGEVAKAAKMVTTRNVNCRSHLNFGVVLLLCRFGPDDPELLRHFAYLGASLEMVKRSSTSLHWATTHNKPKLVRALLDLGANVNTRNSWGLSALQWCRQDDQTCSILLLDAGAEIPFCPAMHKYQCFMTTREKARSASIAILCLHRLFSKSMTTRKKARSASVAILHRRHQQLFSKTKDVLRVVARCVWSTRGLNCWE